MAKSLVTPAGIASFAHIATPDTKGQYADNKYKVTLKLKKGDKAVEEFCKSLRATVKEAVEQQKKDWKKKSLEGFDPVKDGDAKDDAEEKGTAGFWLVTFKSTYQPKVVDSKRKPVPSSVKVFGGDIIKVAYSTEPFEKPVQGKGGCSLYLNAVQLLDKRNDGMGAANAFSEEEGYEAGADEDSADEEKSSGSTKGNDGDF